MPRIDSDGVRHPVSSDVYDVADFPHIAQCPECTHDFPTAAEHARALIRETA